MAAHSAPLFPIFQHSLFSIHSLPRERRKNLTGMLISLAFRHYSRSKQSSAKEAPLSRFGASRCTLSLAFHATPKPAACIIGRSFEPSPTTKVRDKGTLFSFASWHRIKRFFSGVMIGWPGRSLPVRCSYGNADVGPEDSSCFRQSNHGDISRQGPKFGANVQ